jgi:hypothetical protein
MQVSVDQVLEDGAGSLTPGNGWASVEAPGPRLDFTRPFLPESLVAAEKLDFLSPVERLTLNHVRSHAYLRLMWVLKERMLLPVLEHARTGAAEDRFRRTALERLVQEEARQIALLALLHDEFERGFGSACSVIGPPEALAHAVLAHHPLGVALALHHAGWLEERHYGDGVRDPQGLDPRFRALLRHPWRGDALYDRWETLVEAAVAEAGSPLESARGVDDYVAICALVASGLEQQVHFDLENLTRAIGRELSGPERDCFVATQRRANRWTWLGGGMSHPGFVSTLGRLGPAARERVESVIPGYC